MPVVGRLDQYASMLAAEFDDYSMSENLLTYSQLFTDASWLILNSSISENAVVAPDGSLTADKLIENNTNNQHTVYKSRTASNETVTFSVFCKAAERTKVWLQLSNFASATAEAIYDLSAGTASSPNANNADYTNSSTSIVAYPNGWYRCILTTTKGSINTTNNPAISPADASNNLNYLGNGTSGIYIWGAQLEVGSVATDYTPTTTTAINRVLSSITINTNIVATSYTRQNLFLYSEQFNQTSNWATTNSTITANTVASPTQIVTADTITDNATVGTHVVSQSVSVTSGVNYTVSCFVKKGTARYARLALGGAAMTFNSCVFDLDTQTFVSGTGTSESFGNGWYRISCSSSAASTGSGSFSIGISNSTNTGYAGVGDTLYIWGAQLESGLNAKQYNATTTTTVNISVAAGTYYSSQFDENTGFLNKLSANVFPSYDIASDDFGGTLFGPGKGTYMRQNTDKSVVVYNEIDEITII